jgi:hypothetical protein
VIGAWWCCAVAPWPAHPRRWHALLAARQCGAAVAVLTVVSLFAVNSGMKDRTGNSYVNELAGNGIYQFFGAFRSSHLDYDRFYRTLPDRRGLQHRVRAQLKTPDATFVSNDPHDITREISHPGRRSISTWC